jgi:hypothetical protein
MQDLFSLLENGASKLAGAAGAFVAAFILTKEESKKLTIIFFFGGCLVANYASPYLSSLSHLPIEPTAFLVGSFGIKILFKIQDFIGSVPVAIIWSSILKRLGV